jgi:isopentenyl-diphosphate delta-isomerase
MSQPEYVILVDANDKELGVMEKIEAHEKGVLHRAFSLFIVNQKGQMLLQQRALTKYHSPGLWTNACCSHPRKGEDIRSAVIRRAQEELGIEIDPDYLFNFTYKAGFSNGLIEHEFDHVFVARYDEDFAFNPDEVHAYKYVDMTTLLDDVEKHTDMYTPWFLIALPKFMNQCKEFA